MENKIFTYDKAAPDLSGFSFFFYFFFVNKKKEKKENWFSKTGNRASSPVLVKKFAKLHRVASNGVKHAMQSQLFSSWPR